MLLCGVGFGLVSYVVQARGLPYYRYPLLAFLLPLMALDFVEAMELIAARATRLKVAGVLGLAAVCVGGLFLGPQSAVLVHRYRWWETDFISSLQANLERLGGLPCPGTSSAWIRSRGAVRRCTRCGWCRRPACFRTFYCLDREMCR